MKNITTIKLNPMHEMPVIGIKILGEKHADDFIKNGTIHFSKPKIWRDKNACSGKQLDDKDGCFCLSNTLIDEQLRSQGRDFIKEHAIDGWRYFENTDLIVGACFYGAMLSDFQRFTMQYGAKNLPAQQILIPTEYFSSFNENLSSNNKVILIFDLPRLIQLLKNKITALGANEEEIYIFPVDYVNKKVPFIVNEPFPLEFFLKDSDYSEQAEFRIIITSKNEDFYNHLEGNNYNINIGNISSFCSLQDYYTSELTLSIQGDKLVYNLAKPVTLGLDDRSFAELVAELYQILQNQLPGKPKCREELEILIKPIVAHLNNKYGVIYKDDWRLYNVPYSEFTTLSDFYKGMCASVVR